MNTKKHKQHLLDKLYAPYKKCLECPLGFQGRTNVVFGQGNPDARLMFIGEAPGRDEDLQGLPFVGRSGKLLNKILEAIGIERSNIFIANIVKCRPPNNRKPTIQESLTCKTLLLEKQIKIIQPKIICTLGSAATQGLLNDYSLKITKVRGKLTMWNKLPILPTYHPAYILRNPKKLPILADDIAKANKLSL